jgi:hypothetical protein
MTSLNDLMNSHFGFKIDLDYLEHVASKIDPIKKDPYLAYLYSLYVIKGRWSEAEETIKKSKIGL